MVVGRKDKKGLYRFKMVSFQLTPISTIFFPIFVPTTESGEKLCLGCFIFSHAKAGLTNTHRNKWIDIFFKVTFFWLQLSVLLAQQSSTRFNVVFFEIFVLYNNPIYFQRSEPHIPEHFERG